MKSYYDYPALLDHFKGTLFGTLLGDCLGGTVEGGISTDLERLRTVDAILKVGTRNGQALTYTDDTEMAIGLAEALILSGDELDPDQLSDRFRENFHRDRGYGPTYYFILSEITAGMTWREAVQREGFPEGSYGNGSAMRIAPLPLRYFGNEELIRQNAERQAWVSGHHHPCGIYGAQLQALAIHRALICGLEERPFDVRKFISEFRDESPREFHRTLDWVTWAIEKGETNPMAIALVGSGLPVFEAVPAALWFFHLGRNGDTSGWVNTSIYKAAIFSDDRDTIAAMTGAISGAFNGKNWLKNRGYLSVENTEKGEDYLDLLAEKLVQRAIETEQTN